MSAEKKRLRLARDVVDRTSKGDFEGARKHFAKETAAALSSSQISAAWTQLQERVGLFVTIRDVLPDGSKPDGKGGISHAIVITTAHANGVVHIRVVVNDKNEVVAFWARPGRDWSPPNYAAAGSFVERPLGVGEGPALPGTFTFPKSATASTKVRAVVFVHGSGPQDRDEKSGGVRVFKDLAYGLASRGVASIRYDKRTLMAPNSLPRNMNLDNEVTVDARAAALALAAQPEVDSTKIVLVGHSLGASMAPRIIDDNASFAGIVMMAGYARPFDTLLIEQHRYLAGLNGASPADTLEGQLQSIRDGFEKARGPGPDSEVLSIGMIPAPRRYWQDLLAYSPTNRFRLTSVPALILQGARDYQVTTADFELWKTNASGRENVTLKIYAGLNHLFVLGSGPSTPDEYEVDGHVAQEVVDDIAAWVQGI